MSLRAATQLRLLRLEMLSRISKTTTSRLFAWPSVALFLGSGDEAVRNDQEERPGPLLALVITDGGSETRLRRVPRAGDHGADPILPSAPYMHLSQFFTIVNVTKRLTKSTLKLIKLRSAALLFPKYMAYCRRKIVIVSRNIHWRSP